MVMRRGTAEYEAALDEVMDILRRWARESRKENCYYSTLSAELTTNGHRVPQRGKPISHLLEDACRRDSSGPEPLLTSIVIGKSVSSRQPSDQFFTLAMGDPFNRRGPEWTWERERDAVFARYHEN